MKFLILFSCSTLYLSKVNFRLVSINPINNSFNDLLLKLLSRLSFFFAFVNSQSCDSHALIQSSLSLFSKKFFVILVISVFIFSGSISGFSYSPAKTVLSFSTKLVINSGLGLVHITLP